MAICIFGIFVVVSSAPRQASISLNYSEQEEELRGYQSTDIELAYTLNILHIELVLRPDIKTYLLKRVCPPILTRGYETEI